MRKSPIEAARGALKKVLAQRESARQKLAELDAVVAELGASLNGMKSAKIVLPMAPIPQEEPAPERDLDDHDDLGAGRWV